MTKLFEQRVKTMDCKDLTGSAIQFDPVPGKLSWATRLLKWIVNGGVRGWQRPKMAEYRKEFEECARYIIDMALEER